MRIKILGNLRLVAGNGYQAFPGTCGVEQPGIRVGTLARRAWQVLEQAGVVLCPKLAVVRVTEDYRRYQQFMVRNRV